MAVLEYDIRTNAGEHWRRNFVWVTNGVNAPIGSCTAQLVVRSSFGGDALLILTQASGMTLTDGNVYIEITPSQIALVRDGLTDEQVPFPTGIYDLRLTYQDGTQQIFLAGRFIVRKSVAAQ